MCLDEAKRLFAFNPEVYIKRHLDRHPAFFETYLAENPRQLHKYLVKNPDFVAVHIVNGQLPDDYSPAANLVDKHSQIPRPETLLQTERSPHDRGSGRQPSQDHFKRPPSPAAVRKVLQPFSRRKTEVGESNSRPSIGNRVARPEIGTSSEYRLPAAREPPHRNLSSPGGVLKGAITQNTLLKNKTTLQPASHNYAGQLDHLVGRNSGTVHENANRSAGSALPAAATQPTRADSVASQGFTQLINSSTCQPDGQLMSYPAPKLLLDASKNQKGKPKGAWRLYEEDKAIKFMLEIRDEGVVQGEQRFQECSDRLKKNGIERNLFAVKNFWNRTGRERSGFDERRNKKAPLATSKQGKKARQGSEQKRKIESTSSRENDDPAAKGKEVQKLKKKRSTRRRQREEEVLDDDFSDDDVSDDFSVHSEDESSPPPFRHALLEKKRKIAAGDDYRDESPEPPLELLAKKRKISHTAKDDDEDIVFGTQAEWLERKGKAPITAQGGFGDIGQVAQAGPSSRKRPVSADEEFFVKQGPVAANALLATKTRRSPYPDGDYDEDDYDDDSLARAKALGVRPRTKQQMTVSMPPFGFKQSKKRKAEREEEERTVKRQKPTQDT